MKIAFVAISYIPQRDGVSVYTENLLTEILREAMERHYEEFAVDIYACSAAAVTLKAFVDKSCRALQVGDEAARCLRYVVGPYDGALKFLWAGYKVWRYGHYDCVIVPTLQPLALPGAPRVSILHDLSHKVARPYFSLKRYYYLDALAKYRLRRDTAIACISESTRRDLHRYYPESRHKMLIELPNGVPLKLRNVTRPALHQIEQKLSANDLDVMCVGRINYLKGFDRVLEVGRVLDQHIASVNDGDMTLHIVGKETAETSDLLSLGAFQRVKLQRHGYIDDQALHDLYGRCRFCLFLSRNEGFGLPLIEALWSGCVPILSDIPIFREVMGPDFPLFYGEGSGGDAVIEFMLKVRTDAQYRSKILTMMERALERHRDGYQRAARTLLTWIDSMQGPKKPLSGGDYGLRRD